MAAETKSTNSLIRLQKEKICSGLLHRIRLIQGQTNLNFSEPHFADCKDTVRQTKDIIQDIKEDLRKGYSEILKSCEEQARFHSETTSSLSERVKKKRSVQKTQSDKTNNVKAEQQRPGKIGKIIVQDAVDFCEGVVKDDTSGGTELGEIQTLAISGKNNRKKRKRKRKTDENDSNSSIHINQNKTEPNHGDAEPIKIKPRKPRIRSTNKKRIEISGDESDFEDSIALKPSPHSQSRDQIPTNERPRRKLRMKRPKIRAPSVTSLQKADALSKTRDISEMVSSTIRRLNDVNARVTKTIQDSMSSSTSFVSLDTAINLIAPKPQKKIPEKTCADEASASSLNWSTITMSNTNDISEVSIPPPKPVVAKKTHRRAPVARSKPPEAKQQQQQQPPPQEEVQQQESIVESSAAVEDEPFKTISETSSPRPSTPKTKKKKHKSSSEALKGKEEDDKFENRESNSAKKKKNAKNKDAASNIEPVTSAMKKSSAKKRKHKKKDHVVINSIPELMPDPPAPPRPKSAIKIIRLPTPDPPLKKPAAPKTARETPNNPSTPHKHESTRRINSAKSYRHTPKRIIPKVKSTGSLAPDKNSQPLTVRTVLMEENDEAKRRHRSRARSGSRPRSRSESRKREQEHGRPTSRDVMDIYNNLRKNTANTIANINEQMSSTLQEGIAHLNDICGKVRTTLTDMEKDEENYKKLKSKKSFDVSSEGGSVHDESAIFMQPSKAPSKPDAATKSPAPGDMGKIQTFHTVITESKQHTSIGQLMNSISMAGDNTLAEQPKSKPSSSEKAKRRPSSKGKKRPPSVKASKVAALSASTSKTKVASAVAKTQSATKSSTIRIPIWQRTPPSVIEEIQLTVKKQATKSQYKEFLRALKSIAKKQRSQVHVMPTDFKEAMEKQQEKVFEESTKSKTAKKKKEGKPHLDEQAKPKEVCQKCSSNKCTCGVVVENNPTALNQQRTHWMHVRPDARRAIQAYDILDEITLKDLEPIQSEYPRKDHIVDTDANKKIEETLLYKLLYHEDPKVLESLLSSSPSSVTEQKPTSNISTSLSEEKQRSASNAYKLYEQLEFAVEKEKPVIQVHNLLPAKGSICLNSTDSGAKTETNDKPKAMHTCPKEFNDEVNIPVDLRGSSREKAKRKAYRVKLKSDEEVPSMRSKKIIEDKLRVIGKKSSVRSISKRNKRTKLSKENLRVKLKNYSTESKIKMKKILTVMPVSVYPKRRKLSLSDNKSEVLSKKVDMSTLKVSEENRQRIERMSKREIVQKLKPYIFHDLQPPVLVVMPVYPKYNHQNKQQKQDHAPHFNRAPTYKRVTGFLKDHDDDCHSGKKLCRRCQMMMQSGDETGKKTEGRKTEPLSQRQLWKNKYRSTPAENIVKTVLGKNNSRKKFEIVPPEEKPSNKQMVITMTPKQLNKEATNTRNKLQEVKNIMETHKTFLGKDLDDIIDTLEFKIVDALANPSNQHTEAFNEIEHEIKNILQTISDLKEINKDTVESGTFKSKTSVSLQDSTEQVVTSSSNRSTTDTDLIDAKNKRNETLSEIVSSVVTTPCDHVEVEEVKEETLDNAYPSLGEDIGKVIEDLGAIINAEEEKSTAEVTVKVEEVKEVVDDSKEKDEEQSDCEEAINTFCQQVDEVIKNIEIIDELNPSTDNLDNFAKDIEEKRSEDYLTPFMKAVKDYRQCDDTNSFLDFLDKLAMLSKESISLHIYPRIPLYTATSQQNAQVLEVAHTFNRAIQYEELFADKSTEAQFAIDEGVEVKEVTADKTTGVELICGKPMEVEDIPAIRTPESEDFYYEANESVESKEDVLVTNQWMQTDSVEEFEETTNEVLTQTVESGEKFTEVQEYIEEINTETQNSVLLISEKITQVPSDIEHSCFVESSTKDAQVTHDLMEMTSVTIGSQVDYVSNAVNSMECQVISEELLECPTVTSLDVVNDYSDEVVGAEQVGSGVIEGLEKYTTSRVDSDFAGNVSDISFDEYPRNVYTESYLTRDRYAEIHACDKRNSYPVTNIRQNQSGIISLYDSRESTATTNEERDFLEEGFGRQSADSYDSMLARYASSGNVSSKPSTPVTEVRNIIIPVETEKQNFPDELPHSKLIIGDGPDIDDKRHKHLLHSVYGIVFTLMFLGINLNYSCCN